MADVSTVPGDELRDVVDDSQIRRLHAAYVDAVNRAAWSEFEQLFLPDAVVGVSRGGDHLDEVRGPAAVGELIAGYIARYDFLVQVVLNARIGLRDGGDPDAACARLYIAEYRQITGAGRRIESSGVYHDRYRRVDGRWWFARRRYDRLWATAPGDLEVHAFPEGTGFEHAFDGGR
jgi:hypothetical protein